MYRYKASCVYEMKTYLFSVAIGNMKRNNRVVKKVHIRKVHTCKSQNHQEKEIPEKAAKSSESYYNQQDLCTGENDRSKAGNPKVTHQANQKSLGQVRWSLQPHRFGNKRKNCYAVENKKNKKELKRL